MKDMLDRLHWPQVAALAIAVAGLVLALIFVPAATWAAIPWQAILAAVVSIGAGGASALLGPLVRPTDAPRPTRTSSTSLGSDTRGNATVDVVLALGAVAALAWAALRAYAPAILVSLGLAGCAAGCAGLTPLQVGSVSVTVSLRALSAAQDAYDADIERRMSACPAGDAHDACVHAARDVDAETVLDSLDVVIRGIGAGIAIAAEVDAGGAIPNAILHSIREALGLYDRIETILLARGVPVPPEIGVVVHALEALVGTEDAPAVADLARVRGLLLDVRAAL